MAELLVNKLYSLAHQPLHGLLINMKELVSKKYTRLQLVEIF